MPGASPAPGLSAASLVGTPHPFMSAVHTCFRAATATSSSVGDGVAHKSKIQEKPVDPPSRAAWPHAFWEEDVGEGGDYRPS